ncbi:hypothetical protein AC1031_013554 [Aphanomyces cochlioides]|nr:hypothetical protein AC1031_013554 [Aphanomyces cochlioides]
MKDILTLHLFIWSAIGLEDVPKLANPIPMRDRRGISRLCCVSLRFGVAVSSARQSLRQTHDISPRRGRPCASSKCLDGNIYVAVAILSPYKMTGFLRSVCIVSTMGLLVDTARRNLQDDVIPR